MHIFTSLPLHRTNSLFLFFFAAAPLIFFLHLSPSLSPPPLSLSPSRGGRGGDEGRFPLSPSHCVITVLPGLLCLTPSLVEGGKSGVVAPSSPSTAAAARLSLPSPLSLSPSLSRLPPLVAGSQIHPARLSLIARRRQPDPPRPTPPPSEMVHLGVIPAVVRRGPRWPCEDVEEAIPAVVVGKMMEAGRNGAEATGARR